MIDIDYVWMIENEVTAHKRCQLYILIIYSDLWWVRILFRISQHYTHLTLTTSLYVVRVSVFEMTPVRNAFFGIVIGRDRLTFHFFHPLWPNFSWPVAMLILPLPAMLISDLFESQTFCLVFDWQVLEQMMLFFGEAPVGIICFSCQNGGQIHVHCFFRNLFYRLFKLYNGTNFPN